MFFMENEQRHEDKVELRGGIGTLDFRHVIPPELLYGAGSQFGVMSFEPGYSIGVHSHTENYEIYLILEGTAKVTDDGEERILHPGDSEICANGHTHSIVNVGEGTLKLFACILNNFERQKRE